MRPLSTFIVAIPIVLTALAVSCTSYPISKRLRRQAINASFAEVQSNPNAYLDETVIWGGRIIAIENDSMGTTIKVLQIPLNRYLEPTSARYTQGRFLAHTPRFLDPELFEVGLIITVAGTLVGSETQSLGETTYRYPVISIREIEIWVPNLYENYYYYRRPYYRWDPFYGPYYPSPYYRYPLEMRGSPYLPREDRRRSGEDSEDQDSVH